MKNDLLQFKQELLFTKSQPTKQHEGVKAMQFQGGATPMQETYQTPPCQTLTLSYTHIRNLKHNYSNVLPNNTLAHLGS